MSANLADLTFCEVKLMAPSEKVAAKVSERETTASRKHSRKLRLPIAAERLSPQELQYTDGSKGILLHKEE